MANGMRVWGDLQLSPQVTIEAGVNDTITVVVDGVPQSIVLSPGTYKVSHEHFTAPELINEINSKLSILGIPVIARLGGLHYDSPKTVLVLEHLSSDPSHTLTIDPTTSNGFATLFGSIFQSEPANP